MSSSTITVRTAVAREGSTLVGRESDWTEDGYKVWSEYTYIPWEAISGEQVAVEVELPLTFAQAMARTLSLIEHLNSQDPEVPGFEQVFMVNVSTPSEGSFLATGFMSFADAQSELTSFAAV